MTEPRNAARPSRPRRTLLIAGAVFMVLLAAVVGGGFYLSEHLGNNVDRLPNVFGPLDGKARPPVTDALTFLLVGTDTRADGPTTGSNAKGSGSTGNHSDVLMLARVDPSRTKATVVSIPRDSWVPVPGHSMNKINNAFAVGGPTLLVETVEKLTNIRVDHLAVIDFAGFQSMVDAVGGIDMTISASTNIDGVPLNQGVNHLNGVTALGFLRQHDRATDDSRAMREQSALRALLSKATSNGLLSDLDRLYRVLDATTQSVDVDDTLSNGGLASLALTLRDLRTADVQFLRVPVGGVGQQGNQEVDYLDPRSADLWASVRNGSTDAYLNQHQNDVLGTVTR